MMAEDSAPGRSDAVAAIVIDLAYGKRVGIFPSASPAQGGDVEGAVVILPGAWLWIAMGHTDMRKGMQGLVLMVRQALKRDPHGVTCSSFMERARFNDHLTCRDRSACRFTPSGSRQGRFLWP